MLLATFETSYLKVSYVDSLVYGISLVDFVGNITGNILQIMLSIKKIDLLHYFFRVK